MPTALLSVSDKTGVIDLASGLTERGWRIVSSGGTAKALSEAGVEVTSVDDYTGAAEMLGGRVKTLHPTIHGGILADRSEDHLSQLQARGIDAIDLVVCNLYPFVEDPSIEQIDIGGVTLLRAAAKNYAHVGVVIDPGDYALVLEELDAGGITDATRHRLAASAFAHTAAYDAAIANWFATGAREGGDSGDGGAEPALPATVHLSMESTGALRYGENPHQVGARYRWMNGPAGWWESAVVHQGKPMSYLNVFDTEAAWRLVHQIGGADDQVAAVVIKHANPCGAALGSTTLEAYKAAHECDPVSAFGGIVAIGSSVDAATATALIDVFTEVLIAPHVSDEALVVLAQKPNLRVLTADAPRSDLYDVRSVSGGLLVQTPDVVSVNREDWTVVTHATPTDEQWKDLEFAWRVAARVSSNTIVLAKGEQAVGIGAGQQNRRDAGVIAATKAGAKANGGACASDAFFPFRDGLDTAIDAGCAAVIQPGGSVRDDEVIQAANDAGLAMVFTGQRHFRH